jgi:hypothetical protein
LPTFYLAIRSMLNAGFDSIIVNRRTISKKFSHVADIPLMSAQIGEKHPGKDCFVFRREAVTKFVLEHACIGSTGIGNLMHINQLATSAKFSLEEDMHITFHIGDDKTWKGSEDLRRYNANEVIKAVSGLRSQGLLPDHPYITQWLKRKGLF